MLNRKLHTHNRSEIVIFLEDIHMLTLLLSPIASHLLWKLELVVVVVGGQVDVFMNTVQQPKQELQSIML